MIHVRPRSYLSPGVVKEVTALSDWFLRKYIEPFVKDQEPTYIDISFNKRIDTLGLASEGNYDYEYLIELNPVVGYWDYMRTLCHELIHVRQYRLCQMVPVEGGTKWKSGKTKRYKKYDFDVPYMELPWEKEAYALEKHYWGIWQRTKVGRGFLR